MPFFDLIRDTTMERIVRASLRPDLLVINGEHALVVFSCGAKTAGPEVPNFAGAATKRGDIPLLPFRPRDRTDG